MTSKYLTEELEKRRCQELFCNIFALLSGLWQGPEAEKLVSLLAGPKQLQAFLLAMLPVFLFG